MSIYRKQGSRFFWFSFTFNGKRIQKSTKVTNAREAEGIEKAAWTQLARGEVGIADKPEAERKTIGQLLDALTEDFKARKKDTAKNLNLIAMVKAELGEHYADSFKTKDVVAYVARLRKPQKSAKKGRRAKSLSDSTIKHRCQVLSSAYELENRSREDEGIDPLHVPHFPALSEGDPRTGFMTRAQFDVLLSHLPDNGLRDFCLFAYLVGWRKSAVAGLEWGDVRDGNVYLRGVLSKNKKPYYVPILGELVELIDRRRQARSVETENGVTLSNLVFHRNGEPIAEFRKSWATACKKAGREGQLFHDLRRSAARNLIRSGCSVDTAKRLGGWLSDSIFSRYNVTSEEDLQDAVERVSKYNAAESQRVVAMAK
jgi:integrase